MSGDHHSANIVGKKAKDKTSKTKHSDQQSMMAAPTPFFESGFMAGGSKANPIFDSSFDTAEKKPKKKKEVRPTSISRTGTVYTVCILLGRVAEKREEEKEEE